MRSLVLSLAVFVPLPAMAGEYVVKDVIQGGELMRSDSSGVFMGIRERVGHTITQLKTMNPGLEKYADDDIVPAGTRIVVITPADEMSFIQWMNESGVATDPTASLQISYLLGQQGVPYQAIIGHAKEVLSQVAELPIARKF